MEVRPSSVVSIALVEFVVKFSIVVRLAVVRTIDTMMIFPLRMIVRMVELVIVYERGSVEQLPLPLVPPVLGVVQVVVVLVVVEVVAHVVTPVVTPVVWVTVCVPVVTIFPPMLARDELFPRAALRSVAAMSVVTRDAPRDEAHRDEEPHGQW